MSYIITCNTGSDTLSRLDLRNMKVKNLYLRKGILPFGPHGICRYKDNILCANSYNNSVSIIDINDFLEKDNIYGGSHPNDVLCFNDMLYVLCGESNSICVYDMNNYNIEYSIAAGNFPHNITASSKRNMAYVCNSGEETITVLDLLKNKAAHTVNIKEVPMRSIVSNDEKYLYVLISNIGYEKNGKMIIITLDDYNIVNEIETGKGPTDMFQYKDKIYISNLCDNSISIINLNKLKEESRIFFNSVMPKAIAVHNEKIYVTDYNNGNINIIDIKLKNKKVLSLGNEPNALILL